MEVKYFLLLSYIKENLEKVASPKCWLKERVQYYDEGRILSWYKLPRLGRHNVIF